MAERLNWYTESVLAIPFCLISYEETGILSIYIFWVVVSSIFFLYFSLFGEMIQFDLRIFFQMGW